MVYSLYIRSWMYVYSQATFPSAFNRKTEVAIRTAPVALPIALFLSLALTACGGDDQTGGDRPPPEAGFIAVEPEPFTITSELPGRTTPHQVAEVRPQVNGIIEELSLIHI